MDAEIRSAADVELRPALRFRCFAWKAQRGHGVGAYSFPNMRALGLFRLVASLRTICTPALLCTTANLIHSEPKSIPITTCAETHSLPANASSTSSAVVTRRACGAVNMPCQSAVMRCGENCDRAPCIPRSGFLQLRRDFANFKRGDGGCEWDTVSA